MAAPADRIELRGLRVMAVIGVLDHEQTAAQPLEIDVDLTVDTTAAAAGDDLRATVDYGALTGALVEATKAPVALLETLAHRLAEVALADERVATVEVAVRKLRPPVPHDLATAGVRIRRP